MVEITTDTCGYGWAMHTLTISGGNGIDRIVAAAPGYRELLAITASFALVLDGGNVDGSDGLGIVDLVSGRTMTLGTLNSFGTGAPGPRSAVISPDRSHIAIGAGHAIVLLDTGTSAVRKLVSSSTGRFFVPLRWTAAGIFADERPYADYTTQYDLVKVDSATGAVSQVFGEAVGALSPSAGIGVLSTNTNLGDAPCQCQGSPTNTLLSIPIGGQPTVIAKHRDRYLAPIDVTEAGEVLYSQDSTAGSQVAVAASDEGLYVIANGQASLQLHDSVPAEWSWGGAFLDPSTALVQRRVGGFNQTAIEVLLVHLCPNPAAPCTVTATLLSTTPGVWPTGAAIQVVAPAA